MTEEMQKYDLNGDGVIDAEERKIMLEDRRRKMEDDDAQRDPSAHVHSVTLVSIPLVRQPVKPVARRCSN